MTDQAKIVSMHGQNIGSPGHPEEKVIRCLDDMLEAARSGEIAGVAVAVQHADGSTSTRMHGFLCHHGTLGALEMLKHRLLTED